MILQRPIFGYGPEQLDEELSEIMWVDRPGNEFIQHAVFLGIPGLLFYLAALITLFIRQWIHMRKLDNIILILKKLHSKGWSFWVLHLIEKIILSKFSF